MNLLKASTKAGIYHIRDRFKRLTKDNRSTEAIGYKGSAGAIERGVTYHVRDRFKVSIKEQGESIDK
jgi:hypothetical protein